MNVIAHVLGIDNLAGPWYGFWSGIFGDASILARIFPAERRASIVRSAT